MDKKNYTNFVRPKSPTGSPVLQKSVLTGIEAKKLYLEEVREIKDPDSTRVNGRFDTRINAKRKKRESVGQFCESELFLSVQNNDVEKLSQILNTYPDKLNTLDIYGWSLLMIACQANSVCIVKELLRRGIDTSVRDKAGNSARSLVIKNRNVVIADLFLENKPVNLGNIQNTSPNLDVSLEEYTCDICDNNFFLNKQQHLSSTLHNINISKGKKIPTNYVIPETNKGYQIMLKGGWNKETGLGPDGSGKKYPIRAVKKTDKTGLGHKQKTIKNVLSKELETLRMKTVNRDTYQRNRIMEINFRRQFY